MLHVFEFHGEGSKLEKSDILNQSGGRILNKNFLPKMAAASL